MVRVLFKVVMDAMVLLMILQMLMVIAFGKDVLDSPWMIVTVIGCLFWSVAHNSNEKIN